MDLPNKIDKLPIQHQIDFVRFDLYDPETIKRISMKPIIEPVAFDNLNNPNKGGLHDQELGVGAYDKIGSCVTCKQSTEDCTGHFGHIELSAIVYNPFMLNHILKLLRIKCFNCHKLRMTKRDKLYLFMKLLLVKLGLGKQASDLDVFINSTSSESTKVIQNKIVNFLSKFSEIPLSIEEDLQGSEEEEGRDRNHSIDTTNTDDTNNNSNNNIPNSEQQKKHKKKKNQPTDEDVELQAKKKKQADEFKKSIQDRQFFLIEEIFEKIKQMNEKIRNDKSYQIIFDQNLNNNILLKNTVAEFWKKSKAGKCPHCDAMNPKFKKVGNIKFFQGSFSGRVAKRMKKSGIDPNKGTLEEGGATRAEIKKMKKKEKKKKEEKKEDQFLKEEKKKKKMEQDEVLMLSSDESEIDENDSESFKYLTPMEVHEIVRRLWSEDGDLLGIIFGNLIRKNEEKIQSNEEQTFSFKVESTGPSIFFLQSLIVPPNRFRPENKSGGDGGGDFLNAHTALHCKIVALSNELRNMTLSQKEQEEKLNSDTIEETPKKGKEQKEKRKVGMNDIIEKWSNLQDTVNILFDSTKAARKEDKLKGIKQLLEKKQGIYRMKIMGKRVNYAGRSVISPDPMIASSEVGIPLCIAQKLFYTEIVTPFNKSKLRDLVRNGNKKYPGASMVKSEGRNISLDVVKEEYRMTLADKLKEGDKVMRHMLSGDILLVNRQPTLHKSSIMSHKARVLTGEKTIRLHYANCNTYNADFDGDEMNIHFLQNHIARQEAYTISNTDNQYIIPTNGKPIRGLIQDSIVSSVFLTMKNSFFTREEYFQIVYSSLQAPLNNGTIRKMVIQTPAILKPKQLYTGKQIITTILKSLITSKIVDNIINDESVGLNFEHSTKLSQDIWGVDNKLEGRVVVRDNELLTGVLDKNHIGNSEFGLIHAFYEIYGPEMAGELISTLGVLFINYLQFFHGFTCSVDDIILTDETNLKRRRDIEHIVMNGMTGLANFFEIENFELNLNNYSRRNVFTRKTPESIANLKLLPSERKDINRLLDIQNVKIEKLFEDKNNDDEEAEDTAKSYSSIKELKDKYYEIVLKDESHTIDANVDTIVKNAISKPCSEGTKNWLRGLSKSFPRNYFSMMVLSGAKGSLVNHSQITCMLGQQELEGKRVPRMASGRTLPSFEPFDPNPRAGGFVSDRFSTGIRPQEFFFHCMAGREGLIDTAVKTSRSGYLQRCLIKHLEQIVVNYDYTVRDVDGNVIQFIYGDDSVDALHTRYLKNFKFIANNLNTYYDKYRPHRLEGKINLKTMRKVWREIENVKEEERIKELDQDSVLNQYEPWKYLGSISDKLHSDMIKFILEDKEKLFKHDKEEEVKTNISTISKSTFKTAVYTKYLNSLIQPGESVGILAAQSVGEPSTQMTLNTFHLAGHGGANMTLGVPRLREILMTSENNIKTPIMIIPVLTKNLETVKKLARNFEKHFLLDIVKQITINQNIIINKNTKFRKFAICISCESMDNISNYFDHKYETVIKKFKVEFIPRLAKYIAKYIKSTSKKGEILVSQFKPKRGKNLEENEEGEEKEENYESKFKKDEDESEDDNDEQEYEDVKGVKKKKNENTDETFTDEEDKPDNEDETHEMYTDDEGSRETDREEIDENLKKIIRKEEEEEEVEGVDTDEQEEVKLKRKNDKQSKELEYLNNKNFSWEDVRINNMMLNIDINATTFNFELSIPYSQKTILLKNMMDHTLKSITFKSVDKVNRCRVLDEEVKGETKYMLQLEGVNFAEVYKYSHILDINKMYTNDIGNILRKYGVKYKN